MSCKVFPEGANYEPIEWQSVEHEHESTRVSRAASVEENRESLHLQSEIRRLQEHTTQLFDKGVAEGMRRAEAEFEESRNELLERLVSGITQLAQLRASIYRDAEQDLLRLSLAIARRVLRREIGIDPSALLGVVRAALERLDSSEIRRVRAHPALIEPIRSLMQQRAELQRFEIQADGSLQPGDMMFETNRGVLDASLDRQLGEIEAGLVDRLERK